MWVGWRSAVEAGVSVHSTYPVTTQGAEVHGKGGGNLEKPAETPISTKSSKYCKLLRTGFASFLFLSTMPSTWKTLSRRLLKEHLIYFAILTHSADMIQLSYTFPPGRFTRPSYLIIMFQENPDYSLHTFCFDWLPGKLK